MSHMSAIFNFDFQYKSLVHLKCYILTKIASQLDIWLQRYEQFFIFKNNVKHKNLSPFLTCKSKSIFPTSDSFPWSCHIGYFLHGQNYFSVFGDIKDDLLKVTKPLCTLKPYYYTSNYQLSLSVFVIAATTLVVKSTSIPGFEEYCPDNWCWDRDHKSCDVQLSTNQLAAYFHTGIKINTFIQSACL